MQLSETYFQLSLSEFRKYTNKVPNIRNLHLFSLGLTEAEFKQFFSFVTLWQEEHIDKRGQDLYFREQGHNLLALYIALF